MSVGSSLEAINGIVMTMSECAARVIKSAKENFDNFAYHTFYGLQDVYK
jgi:hypothetical protein